MQPLRSSMPCQCGHPLKDHKWEWREYVISQSGGKILLTGCTQCACEFFVPAPEQQVSPEAR